MPRVGAIKLKVFGFRSQVVCLLVVEGLLGFRIHLSSFSGNGGMEETMETTIVGYIGTTMRIHSFIPS